MPFADLFKSRAVIRREVVQELTAEIKKFSLKNPGPLKRWAADLLGVSGQNITPATAYSKSVWVWACVNRWAQLGDVPLQIMAGKDEDAQEVTTGPIRFLMDSPNREQSPQFLWRMCLVSMGLAGEWFLLRDDGLRETGIPSYLQWASPFRMRIDGQADIDRSGRQTHWRLDVGNGNERRLPVAGVIHGMLPNPYNPLRGMSPLKSIALSVDSDYATREHNRWMMARHGRIAGVVSMAERQDEDHLKTLAIMFEQKFGGSQNAGKTMFLDGGATYEPMGQTMKDMDGLENLKVTREEICAAYGVPPNMVGILDKATYSNYDQAAVDLWENCLVPLGTSFCGTLTRGIIERAGDFKHWLRFDFSNVRALQDDEGKRVDRYTKLITAGKMTPRQAAKLTGVDLGDEPNPAYDVVWVPVSEIPAEMAMAEPEPMPTETPAKPPRTPANAPDDEDDIDDPEDSADAGKAHWRAGAGPYAEFRQARGRTIGRVALPYDREINKVMGKYFFQQRASVLSRVDGLMGKLAKSMVPAAAQTKAAVMSASEIADYLLEGTDWNAELVARVSPILERAAAVGGKQVLAEIRQPATNWNPAVMGSFLREESALLGRVNAYTREALMATAGATLTGLQQGLPISDVMEQFKADMRGVYNATEARRRTIARTESMRAVNGGRHAEMVDAGVPMKEWLSVGDGDVRHSHEELDGQTIAIDESWRTSNGNTLNYPGDTAAGPEDTVNCRCVSLPVFKQGGNRE